MYVCMYVCMLFLSTSSLWPPSSIYDIPWRRTVFPLVSPCCLTPKTWLSRWNFVAIMYISLDTCNYIISAYKVCNLIKEKCRLVQIPINGSLSWTDLPVGPAHFPPLSPLPSTTSLLCPTILPLLSPYTHTWNVCPMVLLFQFHIAVDLRRLLPIDFCHEKKQFECLNYNERGKTRNMQGLISKSLNSHRLIMYLGQSTVNANLNEMGCCNFQLFQSMLRIVK